MTLHQKQRSSEFGQSFFRRSKIKINTTLTIIEIIKHAQGANKPNYTGARSLKTLQEMKVLGKDKQLIQSYKNQPLIDEYNKISAANNDSKPPNPMTF